MDRERNEVRQCTTVHRECAKPGQLIGGEDLTRGPSKLKLVHELPVHSISQPSYWRGRRVGLARLATRPTMLLAAPRGTSRWTDDGIRRRHDVHVSGTGSRRVGATRWRPGTKLAREGKQRYGGDHPWRNVVPWRPAARSAIAASRPRMRMVLTSSVGSVGWGPTAPPACLSLIH
jgi:hypothetical protein